MNYNKVYKIHFNIASTKKESPNVAIQFIRVSIR